MHIYIYVVICVYIIICNVHIYIYIYTHIIHTMCVCADLISFMHLTFVHGDQDRRIQGEVFSAGRPFMTGERLGL